MRHPNWLNAYRIVGFVGLIRGLSNVLSNMQIKSNTLLIVNHTAQLEIEIWFMSLIAQVREKYSTMKHVTLLCEMLSVSQLADLINVLSINGNKAANCTPAKPVFMWQIHIREIRWRIWNTNQRVSNSCRNTHLFSILSYYHYHLKSFLSSLRLRDCIKTDKKNKTSSQRTCLHGDIDTIYRRKKNIALQSYQLCQMENMWLQSKKNK